MLTDVPPGKWPSITESTDYDNEQKVVKSHFHEQDFCSYGIEIFAAGARNVKDYILAELDRFECVLAQRFLKTSTPILFG